MGLEALLRGWVSRSLPQAETDNDPGVVRLARYGEIYTIAHSRKQHVLVDEGSYFIANNGGAGIATAAAPTAFSDTLPLLTIQNTDSPSNLNAKRIHLDWARFTQTAVGTAGVDFRVKIVIDTTIPSGGTVLTPTCPNMDVAKSASVATVRLLGTGIVQTGNSRVIVGSLQTIPTKTAAMTIQDEFYLNFGSVEQAYPSINAAPAAFVSKFGWSVPPVVIGPGQCCMIEFLITLQSAASSWSPELGWWER